MERLRLVAERLASEEAAAAQQQEEAAMDVDDKKAEEAVCTPRAAACSRAPSEPLHRRATQQQAPPARALRSRLSVPPKACFFLRVTRARLTLQTEALLRKRLFDAMRTAKQGSWRGGKPAEDAEEGNGIDDPSPGC